MDGMSEYLTGGTWTDRLIMIRETVEDMGKTLKPDGDWLPHLIIEGKMRPGFPGKKLKDLDGDTLMIVGLDPDLMAPGNKDFACAIIYATAMACLAESMTFVQTVWVVTMEKKERYQPKENEAPEERKQRILDEAREHRRIHGQPKDDPNRQEKLMFLHAGPNGQKIVTADIRRTKIFPPQLENWRIANMDAEKGAAGRFPDAVFNGVRDAAVLRQKEGK